MPEGTFATIAATPRRTRTKKAVLFNEASFIAKCEEAIAAERAWHVASKKISHVAPNDIPQDLGAEERRLAMGTAEKFSAMLHVRAETMPALRAKAKMVLATYYDTPHENCDLWEVTRDAARLQIAGTPVAPTAADREIIRLVGQFKQKEAEQRELDAVVETHPAAHAKVRAAEKKTRKLVDQGWKIRLRVAELDATTPEALAAKAWLSVWETCDGDIDAAPICDTKRVPWSLAKDVQRAVAAGSLMALGAAPSDATLFALCDDLMAQAGGEGQPVAESDTTPDASLIALCAEHIAAWHALNDDESGLSEKDNPLSHRYLRAVDAFSATQATTLAGLIAKAHVLKLEGTYPDGREAPEDVAGWTWDLVKGLVRLGPAPSAAATSGIPEITRVALEMGRIDREAREADGPNTVEANNRSDELGDQINAMGRSIIGLMPETTEDVMGKLIATIGTVHSVNARLSESKEDRELGAALRRSLEDCVLVLSKITGRPPEAMGADYFMGMRLRQAAA